MKIITRQEWGARHGDGVDGATTPATEVWLHHSVTIAPDVVAPFDDDDAAIRTIERIGAERFGTVYGFPYTVGVTPVGRAYAGHHPRKMGAHTRGRNGIARAIVLVGNYEDAAPTDAQLDAVAAVLVEGKRRGWWTAARLTGGHRDAPDAATACPGRHAYAAIAEINRRAAALEAAEEGEEMTAEQFAELKAHVTAEVERVASLVWSHPRKDPVLNEVTSMGTISARARRSAYQAATNTAPGTPAEEAAACEDGPQ